VNEIVKEVIIAWPGEVTIINGQLRHSHISRTCGKSRIVEMQLQSQRSEWKGSENVPELGTELRKTWLIRHWFEHI